MKDGAKHLYGVIEVAENLDFGPIRVGNQNNEVYPVIHKELSAIASNTPFRDYSAMTKDLVIRYLLDHQKVVERVMELHPVIPFKFGSLADNEEEIEQILIGGYGLFKSLLPWVRERVEFELVATWDKEKVFKALYEEEGEIRSLQERSGKKSDGDAFLEKIELGKLVRQCLVKRGFLFKEKILSQLKGCAESECDHDAMDDLMILNTAFLVRKEMESEFDRRLQGLDRTFHGEVCFKLIGPLPLYSFKCIEIGWADTQEVCDAFALLGLREDASLADLRRAYYQKAQALHPDRMGDLSDSSSEFEELVKAYKLLKRYCCLYKSLDKKSRIPLIEVRTNGSNGLGKRDRGAALSKIM